MIFISLTAERYSDVKRYLLYDERSFERPNLRPLVVCGRRPRYDCICCFTSLGTCWPHFSISAMMLYTTERLSSELTKVIAVPVLPTRPVRPMR